MSSTVSGVLQCQPRKGGYLRNPEFSFQPGPDDPAVSAKMIQEFGLVNGATVSGPVRSGTREPELAGVESVCGLSPEAFKARTPFDRLIAIDPTQRFRLGDGGNPTMRIVEMIAPIGKGTRGLIVAPPQAGKTQILEEIANAIHAEQPDTRIILLLIDERPEEVTHFRRAVQAEVLASSNDQTIEAHTALAELTMAHVRCELECGRDVVVLVDSITRLVRAFNLHGTGSRRTLSGGIDASAIELPRRFFGLARNIEKGGSVTVIATALIETGSRMDDYVYEEFKSTGNSEIVLDRELAEARIFPAINVHASSTRKEHLLFSDEEMARLTTLRRWLLSGNPKAAMNGLLKLLDQTQSNDELLRRLKPS
ncbi:MAG: transcription termination factor Rho [Caldilineaceae bacterium]|nr:transcription termination factor Rho [Caldilineaceae bacterium]HRJ44445.1 transcription termination factor Rho [Caldilineaceae bacterium]